jgi:NAD(P)-dependent dehydrogenase (short-subunit alcohol dehydrogenase family)
MSGKIAIVTGASTGIGLQTALQLATRDDYRAIVFAVRSPEKCLRSIPEQLESKAIVLYLDLASLESVEQFVSNLALKDISTVDRLVLNAGVNDYTDKKNHKTADGFDEIWQVNFLSQFYLTCLLRPLFAKDARIICLSSVMHWFGNANRFMDLVRDPSSPRANVHYYADSKLAMAVFASELNRRFPESLALAVNPGSVASDIFRHWLVGILGFILRLLAQLILLTTADGARTSVFACTDENHLKKFEYISPYGQIKGWGWVPACMTDLYWFRVTRESPMMVGECATIVTDKTTGKLLWSLAIEALGKTSPKRKRLLDTFE